MENGARDSPIAGSSIAKALPMILLTITALAGNSLVLVSMAICKSLRRLPGNMFIVNLAVTDVMGACLCMPFAMTAVIRNGNWIFGDFVCQFQAFVIVSLSNVTILTLVSYSVFRYYMVTSTRQPSIAHLWKGVKANLIVIWSVGVALSTPPLIGLGKYTYIPTFYACTLEWAANKAYSAFIFAIVFFIPQTIMVFSYYRISKFVRKRQLNKRMRRKVNAVGQLQLNSPSYNKCKDDVFSTGNDNVELDNTSSDKPWSIFLPNRFPEIPEACAEVIFLKRFESRFPFNELVPPDNLSSQLAFPPGNNINSPSIIELRNKSKSPCLSVTHIYLDQNDPEPGIENSVGLPSHLSRFLKPRTRPHKGRSEKHIFRETRLVKLLLFTVLTFYACWMPFAISSFLQTVGYKEPRPPNFDVISMWLAFSNTICNPIIYALLNRQFRKAFRDALRVIFCCSVWTNRSQP